MNRSVANSLRADVSRPVRLIVCINQRLGIDQRSCAGSGNLDYIRQIRQMIDEAGLDVLVVERECLSKCEEGPIMRIAPGGPFFTEINSSLLPQIISELRTFIEEQRSRHA